MISDKIIDEINRNHNFKNEMLLSLLKSKINDKESISMETRKRILERLYYFQVSEIYTKKVLYLLSKINED